MQLSCHCGDVQIKVPSVPAALTSCNCSVCARYGSLWGYYSPDNVEIESSQYSLQNYRWGDECVDFFHCRECGCITHYQTTDKVEQTKIGVNFRMGIWEEVKSIPVRPFDGASSWQYID